MFQIRRYAHFTSSDIAWPGRLLVAVSSVQRVAQVPWYSGTVVVPVAAAAVVVMTMVVVCGVWCWCAWCVAWPVRREFNARMFSISRRGEMLLSHGNEICLAGTLEGRTVWQPQGSDGGCVTCASEEN